MRTRPPAPARPRPRSLAQVPAPGPSVLLKVIEFCLRWVHMVRHGLMSRLDGALRHTIISKTPLTPEWTMQETRKKKNKKIRSWRVGQDDAYTCFSEFSSWVTPRKCIRIECIIQHSLDPVFALHKQERSLLASLASCIIQASQGFKSSNPFIAGAFSFR